MFKTNDLNSSWDGTTQGREVSAGVYFYTIVYRLRCEEEVKRSPFVMLMGGTIIGLALLALVFTIMILAMDEEQAFTNASKSLEAGKFKEAEALFQGGEARLLFPRVRIHVVSLEPILLQVSRRFGSTMVGGQHHQRIVQPDFLIDIREQGRERAV